MAVKQIVFTPPDSADEISALADKAIRRAGAVGILPTPIDDLIAAANIKDTSDNDASISSFLESFGEQAQSTLKSIINKVRGISDLRQPVIYVPTDTKPRQHFAKSHELGHQDMPWHKTYSEKSEFFHDDDYTLSSDVKEVFEQEANFYAAEVIYQGRNFINRARSYRPSFDAVFTLADQHGASRQATLRKYVEAQDEMIAAITYLPSKFHVDTEKRLPVLNAPRLFCSDRFLKKYGNIELPNELLSGHPWAEARDSIEIPEDYMDFKCDGVTLNLWWQAWWNNYSLLIILRREPRFKFLGKMIRI